MDGSVSPFLSMYHSSRDSLLASRSTDSQERQPSWQQSESSSSSSPFQRWPLTPLLSGYLDSYRWMQLQPLLPQVSPAFLPWLHRTNAKEVGTQVRLKADSAVQCSLGSLTLPGGHPFGAAVLYSPLLDRCPFLLPGATGRQEKEKSSERSPEEQKVETGSGEQPEGQAEAALLSQEAAETPREEAAVPRRRSAFQVLEQKYGYFHCKDCKTGWESAYVWCIPGSNKVCFKQFCRKCQKGFNPYRVEAIQCPTCSKTRCFCSEKKRHIDLKRPHRQELCGRCKGKRLSCDKTFSFDYSV